MESKDASVRVNLNAGPFNMQAILDQLRAKRSALQEANALAKLSMKMSQKDTQDKKSGISSQYDAYSQSLDR